MDSRNSTDPIERLFQQKAEEYDISYKEKDWLKLEKQLDQYDQMIANRRMRWFVAAAVLLIFSLLGYAIYQNSQEIQRLHQQLQEQGFTKTSPGSQPNHSDPTAPDTGNNPKNNNPLSNSLAEDREWETGGNKDTADADRNSSERNQGPAPDTADFIVPVEPIQGITESLPCSGCKVGELDKLLSYINLVPAEISPSSPYLAAVTKGKQEDSISPYQTIFNSQSQANLSKLSVGLSAGPALSTAGSLSNFYSPGYSLGFNIVYRLNPNFSIQTGFMRSISRYIATSSDYHPPENFWGYSSVAYKTTAECAILDIPLSIKYDWAHFDRSRLFATAGISSYIMLSEDYQFEYASTGSDQADGWYGKTGTRHWSSNINLSVGYEYDLNNRFSLRAEPFLKLPIREVGWGNVKLYSLGSFISFNYNIY